MGGPALLRTFTLHLPNVSIKMRDVYVVKTKGSVVLLNHAIRFTLKPVSECKGLEALAKVNNWSPDDVVAFSGNETVSYTHLTLPTTERV